ncbi:MAG: hypothetical protein ACYTGC_16150 [Planctomycetota bacterium]|jgi:thiol-disulfide isomerase/thioredoxin
MGTDPIDTMLRELYDGERLAPERERALVDLVNSSMGPARRPSWPKITAVAASLVLAAALGALGMLAAGSRTPTPDPYAEIDVIAIQLAADWCKPSRSIAPRIDELRDRFGRDRVLFVTLDLTDEQTRHQSVAMMRSLGLAEIWERQRGVTGELLLVDAHARTVMRTLTQDDDIAGMITAVDRALGRPPGS